MLNEPGCMQKNAWKEPDKPCVSLPPRVLGVLGRAVALLYVGKTNSQEGCGAAVYRRRPAALSQKGLSRHHVMWGRGHRRVAATAGRFRSSCYTANQVSTVSDSRCTRRRHPPRSDAQAP